MSSPAAFTTSNIRLLEHVNLTQPDQPLATLFYVLGLGLTRDPYLMVELDNMWVNLGRTQMHLPTRAPQRLRGCIHLVVPDLSWVERSLAAVAPRLAGTAFGWARRGEVLEVTCPWGNRFVCGAADELGGARLGIVAVELDVAPGVADAVARFYTEVMGAPARVECAVGSLPMAVVEIAGELPVAGQPGVAMHQQLRFVETDRALPPYDGHHVQIYLADASGPYEACRRLGLITREASRSDWRFVRIVDPADGRLLHELEHEVRDLAHPLYARPLVNRNPAQRQAAYQRGADALDTF
jgi:hypothetical protein